MEQEEFKPITSYSFNPKSIISANNLKDKLLGLEDKILELAKEINNEKKNCTKKCQYKRWSSRSFKKNQ